MGQVVEIFDIKGYDDYAVTLGDRLRGERATQRLTLDDVSGQLHIRPDLLLAIENCDPDGFVSPGYIAGNVRAYAEFLGLDPDACFKQFCEESGFEGVNALPLKDAPSTKPKKEARQHHKAPQVVLSPIAVSEATKLSAFSGVSAGGIASIAAILLISVITSVVGFRFLQEIQRVDIAPLNIAPSVGNVMPDLDNNAVAADSQDLALPVLSSGDEPHRPTVLALPKLTPREGPIASLDLASIGVYAPTVEVVKEAIAPPAPPPQPEVITPEIETVDVFAAEPAWVRIYQPDGGILFEKILDAGQRYRVPRNVSDAVLKAGNAKSVYLLIGTQVFGPLSVSESVAREVSLREDDIRTQYDLAQRQDFELPPPINADDIAFAQPQ